MNIYYINIARIYISKKIFSVYFYLYLFTLKINFIINEIIFKTNEKKIYKKNNNNNLREKNLTWINPKIGR